MTKRPLITILATLGMTAGGAGVARAQYAGSCEAVLSHGIYDAYSTSRSSFNQSEFHNALCNGSVRQVAEGSRAGGGGTVSVGIPGIVDIGLGGDYAQARQFQEYYRQTFCGSTSARSIDDSRLSSFSTVVSPAIVDAYKACVSAKVRGLSVTVQRTTDDVVSFGLAFDQPAATAEFSAVYVFPATAATCRSPTLKPRTRLDGTSRGISCLRTASSWREFTISIHTTAGIFSYLMPALPAPTRAATPPIGSIVAYAGTEEPAGWKLCNGQQLAVKDYPELAAVLKVSAGRADAVVRFAIPDLRGRFLRAANAGATGESRDPEDRQPLSVQGWTTALPRAGWQVSEAGRHSHGAAAIDSPDDQNTIHEHPDRSAGELDIRHPHQLPAAGEHTHVVTGGDLETRPVNVAVNYLIYTGVPSGPR